MKMQVGTLNTNKIKSSGGKNIKMGFSSSAHGMLFDMFTDKQYSNPIGSIVREVMSNCFDAHVEAKNESPANPAFLKHTIDKISNEHFLSFIDNGIGMSPDRIENIYGQYFESTKRDTNGQIGGFGLGGKSPLAYKRGLVGEDGNPITDDEGNPIEDSSFSVITRFNGIKYTYIIYKGEKSPEIDLLFEETTKERNGTEIKIPVLLKDLPRFEQEIKKQLYYFENVVFQGFESDAVLNDFKLYKGEHFIYRGNSYGGAMHICIGKVGYPLNFSTIGLNSYDYDVPVALKFEIGELDVTPPREEIRYTEKTIKRIKEKLELVKAELGEMIGNQHANVINLVDYYKAKSNVGDLHFQDQQTLHIGRCIKTKNIKFPNFKYQDLPKIAETDTIMAVLYHRHEYGKAKNSSTNIRLGEDRFNLYVSNGEFKRKLIKQSYLNSIHDKNFIILKQYVNIFNDLGQEYKLNVLLYNFGIMKDANPLGHGKIQFDDVDGVDKKKCIKLLKALVKEVYALVDCTVDSYDDLEVPQDFIDARKMEKLSKEIINTTIPLKNGNDRWGSRSRVKIKKIIEFKGKIFYATTDDRDIIHIGYTMYKNIFGDKHLSNINYNGINKGKGVLFVTVAKANLKYMKMCPNAYPIDQLYPRLLMRKMINPLNIEVASKFINETSEVEGIYKADGMKLINEEMFNDWVAIKNEVKELEKYNKFSNIDFDNDLISKYFKNKNTKAGIIIKTDKKLARILKIQESNSKKLEFVDFPYYIEDENLSRDKFEGLVELLKQVMVFK